MKLFSHFSKVFQQQESFRPLNSERQRYWQVFSINKCADCFRVAVQGSVMRDFQGFVVALGVLVILTAFFPCVSAFAHGSHEKGPETTASEAAVAADEAAMKNFVLHAKQHMDAAILEGGGERAAFLRKMRIDEEWNYEDSTYLIILNQGGKVRNHGSYTRSLFNDSLNELPVVSKLFSMLEDAQGVPVCYEYEHYRNGSSRWACAVEYDAIPGGEQKNILIGGFDHDENDTAIVRLECGESAPAVTAEDVVASQFISESQSLETLKNFVKEAIKDTNRLERPLARIGCLGKEGPWKSGSIYLFIMRVQGTGAPYVIINGNNQEFTGSDFTDVFDEDGIHVGDEIIKIAGEHGAGGFVEYKWDNPLIEEDDLTEAGMSPGRSPKISYVEGVPLPGRGEDTVFIFGSGIYKPMEAADSGMSDDNGGCAMAGTGGKPESTALNLFLILFFLYIGFLRKDRSRKSKAGFLYSETLPKADPLIGL